MTPLAPKHANVKRGSRSRGGQSAAGGGRAKRWPERDREPLFHPLAKRGGQGAHRGSLTPPDQDHEYYPGSYGDPEDGLRRFTQPALEFFDGLTA